jgi:hypothetical protein
MIENVRREPRITADRWEYIFILAVSWGAFKRFRVEEAFLITSLTIVTALACQPIARRVRETLPTYVVKTISVSIYTICASMLIPAVLKIFLPVPLAYGAPVFLFCLSKYALSKPAYFAASFLNWSLFSLMVSVICAVLAYFVVR